MIALRPESPADAPAIRFVIAQAFGQPAEADLVDALRAASALTVSLVAVKDEIVVGHTGTVRYRPEFDSVSG